jgi:hypothetical protein
VTGSIICLPPEILLAPYLQAGRFATPGESTEIPEDIGIVIGNGFIETLARQLQSVNI